MRVKVKHMGRTSGGGMSPTDGVRLILFHPFGALTSPGGSCPQQTNTPTSSDPPPIRVLKLAPTGSDAGDLTGSRTGDQPCLVRFQVQFKPMSAVPHDPAILVRPELYPRSAGLETRSPVHMSWLSASVLQRPDLCLHPYSKL
ncbi:hypothetical protein H6P81_020039 [Aristolochia fimbriata]|uniref:Uncharacterized protein n=1 Tax=Aristolochia fimbriata TaxID=158543 RepID=A0AAV7DUD0_ARIFI|nr:hypothetical protein H6P81_020039 [Aristolochia fimbriata]